MDTFSKRKNKKDFAEIRINPVCLSGSYLYFGGSYISNKNGEKILELKPFKEHIIIYDNRETYINNMNSSSKKDSISIIVDMIEELANK